MRWVGTVLAVFITFIFDGPIHALSPGVVDPSIELDANASVLISSLYTKRGETFFELHNNTDKPIFLGGWLVRLSSVNSEADISLPAGWLLTDGFFTLSENNIVSGVNGFSTLDLPVAEAIVSVQIIGADGVAVSGVSSLPADITTKWYQRKSTGLSGTFLNDFSAATSSTRLRHTPLYHPPIKQPLLRIIEIYPHAVDCSPVDVSLLCGDYVKLHNPTDQVANIADFRLRSDSSTSESSNAFHLDGFADVLPGGYATVYLRDDGDTMSLTDSGGWVWLEDAEGVMRYEDTIVSYPSAGSDSLIGSAWALGETGWGWTSTPKPNEANSFPKPEPGVGGGVLSDVSVCPQGKYRNPETNRCRNIEDAIATLATCAEGQYRSPETNRCRSQSTLTSAVLSPCGPSQERNPTTNRCRKVASTEGLAPCPTGQTRNVDTNRCRKTLLSAALSPAAINPVTQQTSSPLVMTLLGVAGAGVIGYGIYEWRSEISGVIRKFIVRVGGNR